MACLDPCALWGADVAFDAISHAVMRLHGLFASDAGELPGRDAEAFASYLDVHLEELEEFARDSDGEYASTDWPATFIARDRIA